MGWREFNDTKNTCVIIYLDSDVNPQAFRTDVILSFDSGAPSIKEYANKDILSQYGDLNHVLFIKSNSRQK